MIAKLWRRPKPVDPSQAYDPDSGVSLQPGYRWKFGYSGLGSYKLRLQRHKFLNVWTTVEERWLGQHDDFETEVPRHKENIMHAVKNRADRNSRNRAWMEKNS